MQHVGPFTFNAIRFAVGALAMLPVTRYARPFSQEKTRPTEQKIPVVLGGMLAGLALFAGASLQQVGIVSTTAGKAGFITGLYIVLVPLFGILWGHKTGTLAWLGAVTAVAGLYFLTMNGILDVNSGDLLVLASAFFWAFHVLLIGQFSARIGPLRLAFVQYVICSALSFIVASATERFSLQNIAGAAIPILYAGFFSVGLAYTLQVVAQRKAHPSHAAIILSLEAVFAVLGGWLILGEVVSARGVLGCALMLIGMVLAQLDAGRETISNPFRARAVDTKKA
jgi:drug/metabolite transporter (DMT)-like permease